MLGHSPGKILKSYGICPTWSFNWIYRRDSEDYILLKERTLTLNDTRIPEVHSQDLAPQMYPFTGGVFRSGGNAPKPKTLRSGQLPAPV